MIIFLVDLCNSYKTIELCIHLLCLIDEDFIEIKLSYLKYSVD